MTIEANQDTLHINRFGIIKHVSEANLMWLNNIKKLLIMYKMCRLIEQIFE